MALAGFKQHEQEVKQIAESTIAEAADAEIPKSRCLSCARTTRTRHTIHDSFSLQASAYSCVFLVHMPVSLLNVHG